MGWRPATRPAEQPPPAPWGTLAHARQVGRMGGSGMVAPAAQLQPYGGRVGYTAPQEIAQGYVVIPKLPPDSIYADRPLRGGVYSFPALNEYVPRPRFREDSPAGQVRVMAHQQPAAPRDSERMRATRLVAPVTWREAPAVLDLCCQTGV